VTTNGEEAETIFENVEDLMNGRDSGLEMDAQVDKVSESDVSNLGHVVRVIDDDDESVAIQHANIPSSPAVKFSTSRSGKLFNFSGSGVTI
jgi:recombination DNA repair RAD52 pathway protein